MSPAGDERRIGAMPADRLAIHIGEQRSPCTEEYE